MLVFRARVVLRARVFGWDVNITFAFVMYLYIKEY